MIHDDTRKIKASDTFLAVGKGQAFVNSDLLQVVSAVIKLQKSEVFDYLTQLWKIDWSQITIIGTTGLVSQILSQACIPNQILGTTTTSLTTPELFEIIQTVKNMIDKRVYHLVMEISSIGVVERRISGLPFAVKCLTNITRDHLDYHHTFKAYVDSKMQFLRLPGATIYPRDYKKIPIEFKTFLKGRFNKSNMQAAYAICRALKIPDFIIESTLKTARPPKGRFEPLVSSAPFEVIVDYAHTPDGLINILKTAREITLGRVIVVFGAGGDRDRTKRPLMAKACEELADMMIITSDNPRTESPAQIMADIVSGIMYKSATIIEDRRRAIHSALAMAQSGDTVILAGKGHETYQIIGIEKFPFDDFIEAQKVLEELGYTCES